MSFINLKRSDLDNTSNFPQIEDFDQNQLDNDLEIFQDELNEINEQSEIINHHKDIVEQLNDDQNIQDIEMQENTMPIDKLNQPDALDKFIDLNHPLPNPIDDKNINSLSLVNGSSLEVNKLENQPKTLDDPSKQKLKPQTQFPSLPNNNQKVFINLYHTRQDILKRVLSEDPFYFKFSTIEPYGEEWETDSDGNKRLEKVENSEFLSYDIIWIDSQYTTDKFVLLKNQQKINHFPGMYLLTRKNQLAKILVKMKKMLGKKDQGFFPKTYLLPQEQMELKQVCQKYQKEGKKRYFIIKPEGQSQGKGIQIIKGYQDIALEEEQKLVCQKQMMKPLLIDGLKFDLRLQVLVTSMDPLRIFLHEDGFLRFCTQKYEEPNSNNMHNLFMHLTNYAVNKTSRNFVHNNSSDQMQGQASKRHLKWFKSWLDNNGHDSVQKFKEIEAILIKTLLSVQPQLTHYQKSCQPNDYAANMCFEILGFDIIFDQKVRPQLLEVNHAPSFATESEFDQKVKEKLLSDTFKILYLVGPRAKKSYYKFKQQELNKKIIGKNKWSREEKEELYRKELEKKDAQALENLNGQTRILPNADPVMQADFQRISEAISLFNNNQARKPPAKKEKEEEEARRKQAKKEEALKKDKEESKEIKDTIRKSKEEIQSIVNRLQYSRTSINKAIQDKQRGDHDNYDKHMSNTNVVNINLNIRDKANHRLNYSTENGFQFTRDRYDQDRGFDLNNLQNSLKFQEGNIPRGHILNYYDSFSNNHYTNFKENFYQSNSVTLKQPYGNLEQQNDNTDNINPINNYQNYSNPNNRFISPARKQSNLNHSLISHMDSIPESPKIQKSQLTNSSDPNNYKKIKQKYQSTDGYFERNIQSSNPRERTPDRVYQKESSSSNKPKVVEQNKFNIKFNTKKGSQLPKSMKIKLNKDYFDTELSINGKGANMNKLVGNSVKNQSNLKTNSFNIKI